jgi:hypothetical protein
VVGDAPRGHLPDRSSRRRCVKGFSSLKTRSRCIERGVRCRGGRPRWLRARAELCGIPLNQALSLVVGTRRSAPHDPQGSIGQRKREGEGFDAATVGSGGRRRLTQQLRKTSIIWALNRRCGCVRSYEPIFS